MLLRPVIKSPIKPLVKAIIRSLGSSTTTRTLINLDPVASAYYQLDTSEVFAGEFNASYEVLSTDLSRDMALEDSSLAPSGSVGYALLYIDDPDGLQLLIGNGPSFDRYIFGGQELILDGKLNTVTLTRDVNNDIRAHLNGAQLGPAFSHVGDIIFEGNVGGGKGRYFNGIMANVSFNNAGTTTTFKLDQATANYELSQEASLGAEEIVNGGFDADADWDKGAGWSISGGSANIENQSSTATLSQYGVLEVGKTYRISFDVSTSLGSGIGMQNSTGAIVGSAINGTADFAWIADTTAVRFKRVTGTVTASIDNISIKEIQGNSLTYTNIAQDEREEYQLSDDGTQWDNISPEPQQLPAIIELPNQQESLGELYAGLELFNELELHV